MAINNSFGKEERLSSSKVIDSLFSSGKKLNHYPLRVLWKLNEKAVQTEVRILISVPKKQFAKAVERNLIKRRIREAYRKNKQILLRRTETKEARLVDIAIIYSGKEISEYHEIESKIISALTNIAELI